MPDYTGLINKVISDSIHCKQSLLADRGIQQRLSEIADRIINAYNSGGKVLFCGNGGSAADAQHLAAELSGRFY